MRVTSLVFALALCLGGGLCPALAAGFDGKWIAEIPKQGRCDIPGMMTVLVSGHDLMGEVHRTTGGNPETAYFVGTLDDDGHGAFVVGGAAGGTMAFAGNHFDATWNNGHCDRHVEGDRATDPSTLAATVTDRKDHQDRYADLVRRAQSGDGTIDYSALRAESVYAADWDFYDSKVNGLIDQAATEIKGGDCAAATGALDQALKLDFTADSAHALRSDCLKKAGDAAGARIESAIADGLIHSLMDSGDGGERGLARVVVNDDGADEPHAYVVVTDREEQDVLANREIQVRVRQTEIRGADGRHFDLIKGVSLHAGAPADAAVKSIYFDITSYTTGQASRQAAVDSAFATIH